MSTNQNDSSKKDRKDHGAYAGATALISVLAVPVTLLAGFLLSGKKKH